MTSQDLPRDPSHPPSTDPLLGRVFNERFKILSLIARGGLSAVYRAEQAPLGRTCALKVLKPRYDPTVQFEFHRRFFLEASIASKLSHPNNVTVFDYGHTDDDVYFMAMEFLEGRTLAQAIRAEAPFSEDRILHIARQILRALREAHSLGVIHRDIKPSNVFLVERAGEEDFVKVIDYGLVKDIRAEDGEDITQAGLFMGSPKYVAPEQIQGEAVDGRTDLYSFGIILYEMATGRPPFERSSDVQTLIAHVKDTPPNLRTMCPGCSLSPQLEQLIYRCISKRPSDRFATADELLHLLKQGADAALTSASMSESGRLLSISQPGAVAPGEAKTTVSGPHVFLAGGSTGPSGPLDPALVAAAIPRPSHRIRNLIGGGAVLLATAAIAIALAGRTPVVPAANPAVVAASVPATEPAASTLQTVSPPSSPAVSAAATHTLRIESEPPGASVLLDGPRGRSLCDATPCEAHLGQDGLDDHGRLYISRVGFVAATREVSASDESVTVKLVAIPAAAPPKATATSTGSGFGWYKIDPY